MEYARRCVTRPPRLVIYRGMESNGKLEPAVPFCKRRKLRKAARRTMCCGNYKPWKSSARKHTGLQLAQARSRRTSCNIFKIEKFSNTWKELEVVLVAFLLPITQKTYIF